MSDNEIDELWELAGRVGIGHMATRLRAHEFYRLALAKRDAAPASVQQETSGHLTDAELSDLFDACDFSTMVTADDLFYLIARAVEKRVRSEYQSKSE